MTMPSSLFDALNASGVAQTQTGIDPNFMAQLNQFRNTIAPLLNGANPQSIVQSILAQRGYSPAQIQQMFNQYAAQASAIQKQLMGG